MKASKINHEIVLAFFAALVFCLSIPQTASGQSEKLGTVSYTPPSGWKKSVKENIITFSDIDEAAGKFDIITLYGATPGTGDPKSDFVREWNNLVVKPWAAEANPKTETEVVEGWTVIGAGSPVNFQGNKALAFLTVLSGYGKTVTTLGIFNDESYLPMLVAFSSSLDIEKKAIGHTANA